MGEMTIKKATFINAAAKYFVIFLNIVFTAVLARLLTPSDYGIVAIVSIFTTLFARICDMGFGAAIIQYRELESNDINSIYSFTGILAVILAIAFALLGIPISIFYHDQIYISICMILAVSVFFNCLNMVPNAILLKNKMFIKVALRTVLVNIVGYVIAIICAYFGWKYYSLVLQSVIVSVVDFIWNSYVAKLKFRFRVSMKPIKKVWNYSFFQFIFSWVNYLETNLDNILIGAFLGSVPLAYYDKGFKLISYPMGNISGVVTPVLHPILKDFQNDKEYLSKRYLEVQKVLSIIAVFIVPVFYCASTEIIVMLYGQQWIPAILTFKILSISIYPKIIMGTTGALYCSAGNTKMLSIAGFINAMITGIGIIGGIVVGDINAVAMGVSLANISNMVVTFTILIQIVLKQKVKDYFKAFTGDILAIIAIIIVIQLVFTNIEQGYFTTLVGKILIIGIAYFLYIILSGRYKVFMENSKFKTGR